MECFATFSLIFGVTGECTKILAAMCKLTLVSILAVAIFLQVSAELCLVAWIGNYSVTPLHLTPVLAQALTLVLALALSGVI